MAENSLSQVVSINKGNNSVCIEFLNEGMPVVRTDRVAAHFNRSHKNVLRDIAKLRAKCPESFCQLNFELTSIDVVQPNGGTRSMPAYFLTRDAFSLLVMGFTGAEAIQWKLKYIEAFNALEAAVMEKRASSLVEAAREAGYMQGRDEALGLPALEKERKAAYLKGMAEGKRLQTKRDGLNLLARILDYRARGLTQGETARLLGISHQRVSELLTRARKMGLPSDRPARPVQGSLLEVSHV